MRRQSASCSSSCREARRSRSLGAHEAIDYRSQDFTKLVSGCDAVFDTVGGFDPMRAFGGPQLQDRAVLRYLAEIVPGGATGVARFTAPAVTGLGYLEAVDDTTLLTGNHLTLFEAPQVIELARTLDAAMARHDG